MSAESVLIDGGGPDLSYRSDRSDRRGLKHVLLLSACVLSDPDRGFAEK